MLALSKEQQIQVLGGTKYVCGGCGYTFGSTGMMVITWGSVSAAKKMHAYYKHNNVSQSWTTK